MCSSDLDVSSECVMPDESYLVLDARALVARAVQVIDDSKKWRLHSLASLTNTIEHVTWSDQLIGESRLVADRLREAIATFAACERDNGAPPERVIRLVKGIIGDARTDKLDPNDARSLLDDVVRWAIEAYYYRAAPVTPLRGAST